MSALHALVPLAGLSTALVRWIHFVALAAVLGGALAVALPDGPSPALARRYEYVFWVAIGLVVVSGVGNVGTLAPAVPDAGSRWGRLFGIKLLGVVGLIVGSLVRTAVAVRTPPDGTADRRLYALTAAWVIGLAGVAVVMARG